ncbi:hypothetical protein NEICINOT_04923 [Neisseria cinerea ATCC 14685]|uniref:Uncharacterized protein n=1 Tax=Neisseria cinerea ATCC 14685 TaxID=546262 RepID=D0W5G0_NEICI|nr:hypothetical protein NEICINOT_04923 [Neisseria cinerea ATCC 14685]
MPSETLRFRRHFDRRQTYFGNTKNLINNSLNTKPNTPKPKTKNKTAMPNLPALDSLPKFQTIKPKKIIKPVRQIFNAQSAKTASSIFFSYC